MRSMIMQKIVDRAIDQCDVKDNDGSIVKCSIEIKTPEHRYMLIRLDDDQYFELRKNSVSIGEDYCFLMGLVGDDGLIFRSWSRMYAMLNQLFGESGRCFDDWKGSFSFPFLIHRLGSSEDQCFGYMINIRNVRSCIEFGLSKLIKANGDSMDRMVIHPPFDDFPREEINFCCGYVVGYLSGYFNAVHNRYKKEFFKTVTSNLILFGYRNGEFFDREFESEDEFNGEVEKLKYAIAGMHHSGSSLLSPGS